ncbi:hypothetical protein BYT27DRAFT_7224873 [Phlegmacium glaucopus]|nr:hypothetical protein BYT27DRAFT_7224873 [Phlegmacium glaucopus]
MPSQSATCPGCDNIFSLRGYQSHLALSRDPLCCAVFNKLKKANDTYELLMSSKETSGAGSDAEAVPFQGDTFRTTQDYASDTFGQDNNVDPPPLMDGYDDEDSDNEEEGDDEEMAPPMVEVSDDEDDDEDGGEEMANMVAELEKSWEPPREGAPRQEAEDDLSQLNSSNESRDYGYTAALGGGDNPWAPFNSRKDWEIARWAKLRGVGSMAFSDLLAIDGVCEALNLSYKNSDELNQIIYTKLPGRPQFTRQEVVQSGEVLEFYTRDIIECLRALWGDPDFEDQDMTIWIYHEMNTGKWWWDTQVIISSILFYSLCLLQKKVQATTRSKNIMIIPIIISSDKTQLTQFRGKMAYPVYLTIGNIPKNICRKPSQQSQVLLAYLPTSKLDHIKNKASRRRCMSNLFHHCMQVVVKPLESAGRNGIILISGDGAVRRCFPILTTYVGDYPEQVLVSLVKTGNCPICPAPRDNIDDWETLNAIDKGAAEFTKACANAGIKPVQCVFWKNLPFVDIYRSITPNILHQLYQGLLKHLIAWIRATCGDAEIDARCRRFPPNHHIRLFMKGISHLSRVTGTEHDQISRFLLALVANIRLPDGHSNAQLVRTVRVVLNFIYLARYPIHTSEMLAQMNDALHMFHLNRDIFISLEFMERLHIDLAKDAYSSTNFKDEFPQMTLWLDQKERIMQHEKYLRQRLDTSFNMPLHVQKPIPSLIPERRLRMTKHPTHRSIPIKVVCTKYGATQFIPALSRFIAQYQHPEYSKAQVEIASNSIHIPFSKVSVFHRLKFVSYDIYSLNPLDEIVVDSIHVDPVHFDKYRNVVPGRFDTAVIQVKDHDPHGNSGLKVRCIFSLPPHALDLWFPASTFSHKHLAYVSRLMARGEHHVSIIPVSLILSSIHLFPKFGPQAPVSWSLSNVLESAVSFYVNSFSDRFVYSHIS